MAKRKRAGPLQGEAPPEGAPEWIVTYGDMMTLLMCFFVLLFSMSEVREAKVQVVKFVNSLRVAFGGFEMITSESEVPGEGAPNDQEAIRESTRGWDLHVDSSVDPEVWRELHDRSRRVEAQGDYVVGIAGTFAAGGADLPDDMRETLGGVAREIRGSTTTIEVIGHAAPQEAGDLPPSVRDLTDLSYERARAAAEALVEGGVRRERIRIVAAGVHGPDGFAQDRSYNLRFNRRVTVIVTDEITPAMGGD